MAWRSATLARARARAGPGPFRDARGRANFPDTLITRGLDQQHLDPPFVVGNEGAGVVTEVGWEVTGLSVGDRVLTLTGSGAFAEFVLATPPPQQVHRIPDEMPFHHVAAFDLTYGTAAHGLAERGSVQPGETVLVTGAAGGCGSAAVQIARALGARVIAVVGGPVKMARAGARRRRRRRPPRARERRMGAVDPCARADRWAWSRRGVRQRRRARQFRRRA